MTEQDRARWDDRYSALGPVVDSDEIRPPTRFAAHAEMFPKAGQALDVACGTGEHAVWLAQRGLDVWGIDVSPVAIEHARELAAHHRVDDRCRFDVVDLDDGLPTGPAVDCILCHRFRDPRLEAAIVRRLAPGGLLAVVALSEVGATPGRFRAAPGELVAAFAGLDIVTTGEADGEAWLLANARA